MIMRIIYTLYTDGFHKVVSADSGGLRLEKDEMEFAHQHFLRGQESLLENIKRKVFISVALKFIIKLFDNVCCAYIKLVSFEAWILDELKI